MKRKTVVALLVCVALATTGCGSSETKETEAVTTEVATEAATTEAATTEEATTEEATTEEATTEEATTEEATTEEATTEEATTEEATTEEATTEEVTTEEATTEEATTEKVTTEEATTEEATTEEATTEEATTEEVTTEEATTEEATTEEATTEEVTTEEATTEEVTTEEATTEEATREEATESESETETETETEFTDLPAYVASDYVTLGDYKEITVTIDSIEVSEEEVEQKIASETIETLEEGTVEEGDIANIDYEGKLDGEAFDGGTATGYDLEIGSGTFIEGFESGLIGTAIGETVDLNLTFPEKYHSEDLAGKDVVFTVTVNSVQRVPELTDEVAAKVADGKTAEEYKESIRKELEESAAAQMDYNAQYEILQQVVENASVDGYPEEALNYNMWRVRDYYEQISEMSGISLEDMLAYYGMTEEDFDVMVEKTAQEGLAQSLVLTAVAEAEGLEVTDEEYEDGLLRYTEIQGYETAEELVAEYGENYIRNSLMQEKAMDFLRENATVVTEKETEAESETEEAAEEETVKETETETETETESESETETETAAETETETES